MAPDPRVEAPYQLTPQTMLRAGVIGAVVLAIFALLFIRLWSLQVLNSKQYLRVAETNQVRVVPIAAARGRILDRFGRVIVRNRPSTAIVIVPTKPFPTNRSDQDTLLRKLQKLTGTPAFGPDGLRSQIDDRVRAGDTLTPIIVKEDVNQYLQEYLVEQKSKFPGIEIADTSVRTYPRHDTAAHILGYVGEVTAAELKADKGQGLKPGDEVGQSGVERAFDDLLRGKPGEEIQSVNSLNRPVGPLKELNAPIPGYDVRLTIDLKLQEAAEKALVYGIQTAHANQQYYANGGAIVALDPRDGAVRALASYPTYDPSVFTGRVTTKRLLAQGLLDPAATKMNSPGIDRATAGIYAPGSTFKPMTAIAGMESGQLSANELINCPGSLTVDKHKFNNWDPYSSGLIDLATALSISCDTYFYEVGYRIYKLGVTHGSPIQDWASQFGFGKPSGFDLGGEASGLLPTLAWRKRTYTKKTDPTNWQIDRLWKSGDSIQLAIGQKDLRVTPLQMARFYAALANGGKLVTPHVFDYAEQADHVPLLTSLHVPPAAKQIHLQPGVLDAIKTGLYRATHDTTGTSSAIFGSFPIPIAGKTGTAEQTVDGVTRNQSWWCGFGPTDKPTLVVCALIENGGHGGVSAAPAARKVFEAFFHKQGATIGTVKSD
jgi:penicillin-binding protein 2